MHQGSWRGRSGAGQEARRGTGPRRYNRRMRLLGLAVLIELMLAGCSAGNGGGRGTGGAGGGGGAGGATTSPPTKVADCSRLAAPGVFEDITPADVRTTIGQKTSDGQTKGGPFAMAVDPVNQGTVYSGT